MQITETESKPIRQRSTKQILKELALIGGIILVGTLLLYGLRYLSLSAIVPIGLLLMAVLAYWNGANDVSKAIATLVGSGVTNYRLAIIYGSICTVAGASISAFLSGGLVTAFTKGLIVGPGGSTAQFALAAVVGAILWVYLATRLALPVSTTHAITGAVVASGIIAVGTDHVLWGNLGGRILLPLLLSPLVAFAGGLALYWVMKRVLPGRKLLGVHWISSGFTSFTRGLNDAPKIVAMGTAFVLIGGNSGAPPFWLFFLVALAMGVGSWIGGQKVTQTLAERIITMDHQEGIAANLMTAFLVGLSSPLSLPLSTTHVSSCAILGVGLHKGRRQVHWPTVWEIVLAWIITLPVAGLLALVTSFLFGLALR